MRLKQLELIGFKSFAKKTAFLFEAPITAIVGPNGSGKSNCAEAFRWVLGERSMKSLRGTRGEDLIFHGGSPTGGAKMNRAAVTLVFDNHDRKCDIDFDEVAITREVYRDGTNVYSVNGSAVRYRDLVELLAGVSLGSNAHYIISQGEADGLLGASVSERRAMVEDALGLRLYQWKIAESEKKLEQTETNLKQVESLRRELAPHLRYLQKQVEKIKQADELRAKLRDLYLDYLRREDAYLQDEHNKIMAVKLAPQHELGQLERQLAESSRTVLDEGLDKLGVAWRKSLAKIDDLSRRLGRLEGLIEVRTPVARQFDPTQIETLVTELNRELEAAENLAEPSLFRAAIARLKSLVGAFWHEDRTASPASDLAKMRQEKQSLEEQIATQKQRVAEIEQERNKLQTTIITLGQWRARRSELASELNVVKAREERSKLEAEDFQRQIEEGKVLVGQEIINYRAPTEPSGWPEAREAQLERRRQLERLKIRLEDTQVELGDTLKEFKEVSGREEFLIKEIGDLEAGASSLRQIIEDLRQKIDEEFKAGVEKINGYFQEFFALMFGGGTALLQVVKEKIPAPEDSEHLLESEEPSSEGLDVIVNLPRKKIKGLEMLSGGERALCSIALLFAMSQVNPPPFLVLDETDAALDEANSRKYGELVENLAQHSQLILITHNRETMAHANVIYGVTMGSDGVSKLLSIKFDEAVSFAK